MNGVKPFEHVFKIDTENIFFRKLFYESSDLLLIFDFVEERCIEINQAALSFSGYTKAEFLKLTRKDLTPRFSKFAPNADLHKTYLEDHRTKIINGEQIKDKGIFKKKNGEELISNLEIIPTGRKIGEAFLIIKDITSQLQNNVELIKTKDNYKSIVESTASGISVLTLDGKHSFVSPQVEKILGYKPEELLGKLPMSFFNENDHHKIRKIAEDLLEGKIESSHEVLEAKHKEGHSIWLQNTAILKKDNSGNPISVQNVFVDITEKVLLERELQITNNKFRQIIENLEGIFMVVNVEGNIEYVSPKFESVLGYSLEEMVGSRGLRIFCEEDAQLISKHGLKLIAGEADPYNSTYKAYIRTDQRSGLMVHIH